jgi:hypothetical protein
MRYEPLTVMPSLRSARLVSVVVPTLREDEIDRTLTAMGVELSPVSDRDFEILLVDDSAEPFKRLLDEAAVAFTSRFGPKLTARRLDGPRKGKGAAMRVGVLESQGDIVFWMDADMPVPLENVARFLALFDTEGADVVVAERPFDRNLGKPVRFVASCVLFAFQRGVVFQSRAFEDTQCGFKAFRGELAREIAQSQIVDGGMVDIEYLFAARLAGARCVRISVTPNEDTRPSRINVKKAMVQDPVDLFRVKFHGIAGGYASAAAHVAEIARRAGSGAPVAPTSASPGGGPAPSAARRARVL